MSRFKTYKTAALLARLALYAERSHSRDELIGLLWPNAEYEAGRASLRTALAVLRRELAEPGESGRNAGMPLCADRLQVGFSPGSLCVDVAAFEAAVRAAERAAGPRQAERLTEALDLYRGDLLPGYHEEWIISERERLSLLYRASLRRLIAAWEERGDPAQALEIAQRAGSLFPAEEEIQRPLIRLYAQMGRPDEARRQFQTLERMLREEGAGPPSQATRALVAVLLPNDPETTPIFSSVPARPSRFPPLLLPLTRFFGRAAELEDVGALLRCPDVRLVTLTGPGGTGKTRLALQMAQHLTGDFQGAVLFIGLADLTDGDGILEALADALPLSLKAAPSPIEQIAAALNGQPALLILDNLEQIAGSAAPWIEGLLKYAPGLTCIVTSRQRLDIPGEREFAVLPLPVPSATATSSASPADFAGVQLFVDRAQAALPEFQITPQNTAAVAALCERLEGIPLALELAAAWAQTLTPAQMLERLEDRFSLLVSRRQAVPPRHRTLWAAIDWSYRLLPHALQRFFGQLSVFRGGWSLEAAEAVCNEPDVLEMLSRLRSRSLLVTAEEGGVMRFQMLESIREFAADQITEQTEEEHRCLARRHTDYFVHLAGQAQEMLAGPDQIHWLDRLEAEHANLCAVIDRCLAEPTDPDTGVHLMSLLGRFWYTRGHWREQRRLLEALLAQESISVKARAVALYQLGDAAKYLGDIRASEEAYTGTLAFCDESGDHRGAAQCLRSLGGLAQDRGDYKVGREFLERCLSLRRGLGGSSEIADALQNLGRLIQASGDSVAACAHYRESLSLARQAGDESVAASVLTELALAALDENRCDEAHELLEERLRIVRRLGNWSAIANTLMNLGRLARTQGEAARAVSLVKEAVSVYRILGYQEALADSLKHLGELAALAEDHRGAEAAVTERLEILGRLAGTAADAPGLRTCPKSV